MLSTLGIVKIAAARPIYGCSIHSNYSYRHPSETFMIRIPLKPLKSAMLVAVALCAAPVMSQAGSETVAVKVNAAGLDLGSPAGAQKMFARLTVAAEQACGFESEFDAVRTAKFDHCFRDSLSNAVRALNRPLVTQLYVERHPREAAMYGIASGDYVAAK